LTLLVKWFKNLVLVLLKNQRELKVMKIEVGIKTLEKTYFYKILFVIISLMTAGYGGYFIGVKAERLRLSSYYSMDSIPPDEARETTKPKEPALIKSERKKTVHT
jgi:hypothetical protein